VRGKHRKGGSMKVDWLDILFWFGMVVAIAIASVLLPSMGRGH
jgi:hypothetical protein